MLPDHPEHMPIKETKTVEEKVVWEEDLVVKEMVVWEEDINKEMVVWVEDINKEKEENLLM